MRVIAGEFRSRRLQSLPGDDVRPTSDKLRETLFDILGPSIAGLVFVDAYAGTGAVGIEAISRGARHVVFIEKNKDACELIKSNLALLKIGRQGRLIHGAAGLHLGKLEADIVFIDPPYPKEREYEAAMEALEETPPALVVVQHSSRFALREHYGPLRRTRIVKQGENSLSFYKPIETAVSQAEPAPQEACLTRENPEAVLEDKQEAHREGHSEEHSEADPE
jgi:16S rRNA (guanine966-N2)-methyltransferase